jgi:hypothetical protein
MSVRLFFKANSMNILPPRDCQREALGLSGGGLDWQKFIADVLSCRFQLSPSPGRGITAVCMLHVDLMSFSFFAHSYIGRKPSASTATGIKKQHKIEEKQMLKEAMAL